MRAASAATHDLAHEEEGEEGFDPDDATWELRRDFAAVALDQAALDDRVRPIVAEVLRRWRRSPDYALRWTAANTLGLEFGLSRSRSRLRSCGLLEPHGSCWSCATYHLKNALRCGTCGGSQDSVSRGFSPLGAARMCRALARWLRHERKSVRELAQQAVVIMAELKMSAVREEVGGRYGTPAATTSRERWPVALALSVENPPLKGRIAGLVRTVLGSRPAGEVLMKDIGSWWSSVNPTRVPSTRFLSWSLTWSLTSATAAASTTPSTGVVDAGIALSRPT